MKNLDLNNYGVQEMNAEEMNGTDGGWLLVVAITVVMLLCAQDAQ